MSVKAHKAGNITFWADVKAKKFSIETVKDVVVLCDYAYDWDNSEDWPVLRVANGMTRVFLYTGKGKWKGIVTEPMVLSQARKLERAIHFYGDGRVGPKFIGRRM